MDRDQIESGEKYAEQGQTDTRGHALKAAWRSDTTGGAHQQAEIEPAGMDQQPLEDTRVTAQMRAAHAVCVIEMGERAFDPVAALAHQAAAAAAANPSAIAIHRRLRLRRLGPVAAPAVGTGAAPAAGEHTGNSPWLRTLTAVCRRGLQHGAPAQAHRGPLLLPDELHSVWIRPTGRSRFVLQRDWPADALVVVPQLELEHAGTHCPPETPVIDCPVGDLVA